eukprot:383889-Rhodomonas_salina.1
MLSQTSSTDAQPDIVHRCSARQRARARGQRKASMTDLRMERTNRSCGGEISGHSAAEDNTIPLHSTPSSLERWLLREGGWGG